MKVGLISDVHGDFASLMTALRIFRNEKVNKILCAGDLVEKGAQGDAVVSMIRGLNIPCVLGNHDEVAKGNQAWIKDNMDIAHPNVKKQILKPETTEYVSQFPKTLRYEWQGLRILLCHGSPKSNVEYLMPSTQTKYFVDHARTSDADIIICGHTHRPMHYVVEGVHFINPGATCEGEFISSNTCAILTLPEKIVTLYHLDTQKSEDLPAQTPPN